MAEEVGDLIGRAMALQRLLHEDEGGVLVAGPQLARQQVPFFSTSGVGFVTGKLWTGQAEAEVCLML